MDRVERIERNENVEVGYSDDFAGQRTANYCYIWGEQNESQTVKD